jgi:carboxyvinyl-carboxyphosphonate phosphorylmutase
MTPTAQRERFRAVLAGPGCVHPASVWDAMSARIAWDLGFETGILAGSTASLAVLGAPDLILLTLTEFADQARRIGRAARLPLLVDADHGYGNALNVMRTVQELEASGVAALTIEDTDLPRAFGSDGARLLPLDAAVGKIKAALAARADPALVVVARTSALELTGVEDAVARVRAYAALGADAIFLAGVQDGAQLDAVAAAIDLPLIVSGTTDPAAYAAQRVRISLQGHQPIMAAVQAAYATFKALRDGMAPASLPGLPPAALMRQATRREDYDGWTRAFLEG